ncbi:cytochrome b [Hyphobacterium sp.]|uniref:cytochrome b n=1 Tax=Hyphobacterium sp. TaxID=2004662 RepID=UPI003BACB206
MTESKRYTGVAISLHWIMAITIIVLIFAGWRAGDMSDALFAGDTSVSFTDVTTLYSWHKTFGILVLVLSVFRLLWRFMNPPPPLPDNMKPWEKTASRFTHWAFYALMIGMPIGGWLTASASGFPNYLFNVESIELPNLVSENEALHEVTARAHSAGAWIILGLLALHIAAALQHHFIKKDDVLTRMVIFLKQRD